MDDRVRHKNLFSFIYSHIAYQCPIIKSVQAIYAKFCGNAPFACSFNDAHRYASVQAHKANIIDVSKNIVVLCECRLTWVHFMKRNTEQGKKKLVEALLLLYKKANAKVSLMHR